MPGQMSTDLGDLGKAIEQGVSFLDRCQQQSGELPSYWQFPAGGQADWALETSPFATALAVISLAQVPGADGVRARAVRFLVAEMEAPCVWRHYASGSRDHRNIPPDLDDIACASMALNIEGVSTDANRPIVASNRTPGGTFYTWVYPRFPFPVAVPWWQAAWREIPAWPRRRRFWSETSADPDDVDCVVNAHVVTYLGPGEMTRAASAYLVDVLCDDGGSTCDKWYPHPARFHYAVSRAIRGGNRVLGLAAPVVVECLERHLDASGKACILPTALAAAALHNLGWHGPAYESAVSQLLASQAPDGSWSRDPLYVGGPDPAPVWASEALTTATCLEVLAGYRQHLLPADRKRE